MFLTLVMNFDKNRVVTVVATGELGAPPPPPPPPINLQITYYFYTKSEDFCDKATKIAPPPPHPPEVPVQLCDM